MKKLVTMNEIVKPSISMGERISQVITIISQLPLGFGYEVTWGTDGTQVPVVTVKFNTGCNDFYQGDIVKSISCSENEPDAMWDRMLDDLVKDVSDICEKYRKPSMYDNIPDDSFFEVPLPPGGLE